MLLCGHLCVIGARLQETLDCIFSGEKVYFIAIHNFCIYLCVAHYISRNIFQNIGYAASFDQNAGDETLQVLFAEKCLKDVWGLTHYQ